MPKPVRRIKKANIRFLSLCTLGANGFSSIYKSLEGVEGEGQFEFCTLTKEMDEQGEILSLVYAPESTDLEGDVASVDVIKEMCHSFSKNKGEIDIRHDGKPVGTDKAYVAESFIVQKEDARFVDFKDRQGNNVNAEGAWAVTVKLEDEDLRKLYREGKWDGISMGGTGQVEIIKQQDKLDATNFIKSLAKLFKLSGGPDSDINPEKEEIDMKPEEVQKTVEEALQKAIPSIAEQVRKADASKEGYTGDLNDKEALRKHLASLDAKDESKVDINDIESIKKHLARLQAQSLDLTDAEAVQKHLDSLKGTGEQDSEEVKKAKSEAAEANEKLRKLMKQSNQSFHSSTGEDENTPLKKSVKTMADMGSYASR